MSGETMGGHAGGCPCCQPLALCRVTLTYVDRDEEIATDITFTAPRSQTRDAAGFRQALACVAWGAAFTAGGGAWDVGGDEADPLQCGSGEWELGAIEVSTEYRGEPFYLNARIDGPVTDDMPFAPVLSYLASGFPALAVYPNRRRAEEAARVEREARVDREAGTKPLGLGELPPAPSPKAGTCFETSHVHPMMAPDDAWETTSVGFGTMGDTTIGGRVWAYLGTRRIDGSTCYVWEAVDGARGPAIAQTLAYVGAPR